MSSANVDLVKSPYDLGNGLSYALAIRRAVGLNFCTSGWLRKVSKSASQQVRNTRIEKAASRLDS